MIWLLFKFQFHFSSVLLSLLFINNEQLLFSKLLLLEVKTSFQLVSPTVLSKHTSFTQTPVSTQGGLVRIFFWPLLSIIRRCFGYSGKSKNSLSELLVLELRDELLF